MSISTAKTNQIQIQMLFLVEIHVLVDSIGVLFGAQGTLGLEGGQK